MDYFILNRWVLRAAGLWPHETSSKVVYRLYQCFAVFCFVFAGLYHVITEFISIKDTYCNFEALIKNLSFALTGLLGVIKIIFWYCQNKKLKELINVLESDEFSYESLGDFQPEGVFKQARRTGIKYTFIFLMMTYMTFVTSYIPPVVLAFVKSGRGEYGSGNVTFHQQLPHYTWMPFKYDTPILYLYGTCYQLLGMIPLGHSIVGMDTLFMNIMNVIGSHMTVLTGAFKSVVERCRTNAKRCKIARHSNVTARLDRMLGKEFNLSVRHLQTMFTVCKDMESIYKYLTLAQVLFTLFVFCMCLFVVSTTPITSGRFASEIVYMAAMGFQLLLYCWFGNEVTLKASEIPNALWENDWLETEYSYKSSMLITMIRMRRPLYLTAGEFAPLTLATFMGILRSSYSFFAVLKHIND